MDVFRFINPENPTKLDQGKLINGLKSKMWAERYREAGEFEFIANIYEGAHKDLPIGSLVSHVETEEVMIVENHEIREDVGVPTEIKITGRSFEAFFENRVIGSNKAWSSDANVEEYTLASDYSWNQTVVMLKDHIDPAMVLDQDDALQHVQVISTVDGISDEEERSIPFGDVYSRTIELLSIDDLGIKTVRPGPRSPLGWDSSDMAIVIHQGLDLTSEVGFSHIVGDLESADYLWTDKRLKNTALVTGRWAGVMVKTGPPGLERRMMHVDATDIDDFYSEPITNPFTLIVVTNKMAIRGRLALASQNSVALLKTETIKNSPTHRYREHYDLGDIVTVEGEYSETAPMQITEYVEIEDENGNTGYPTLSAI